MKVAKTLEKKRKTVKDGPRRPLTAYNLFFQIGRQRLVNGESVDDISVTDIDNMTIHQQARHKLRTTHQRTHGKIGFQELAKTLGEKWRALDPLCKRRLDELAVQEKKRYATEMAAWKKNREASSSKNAKNTTLVRPSSMNLRARNISAQSSKKKIPQTQPMPRYAIAKHPVDHTPGYHDEGNDVANPEGFHRYVPPPTEIQAGFHPSSLQNEHFQQYTAYIESYHNHPYDAPTGVWQGATGTTQTSSQPYCTVPCETFHPLSPRKVSLSSCQTMERAASYDGIEPVQIKEWTQPPPHNAYEDYLHRYPVARPIEQHAHLSCEETNMVHSLTNIDMDFLSVHCEDNDDISVLGM
ncbi:hypothetical protein FisN_6Hh310 [Fistulifera solaris]|jgi:hypothetical protein|uniref:HMG box domain-containing protein n=1 Tax=Fistulifera solaris TaxID=1519565 RepID=A0A1Z5K705_FISSO|nr:hypothetical protein FisN_6Hh310 [Fistulifera solaris]|eukprot:GAX22063.1 hypothetical protein FisN_6Hh310 [Fistulifera solaris]